MEHPNVWEATNMLNVPFSGIRMVSEIAQKMRRDGIDVIELTMGRPDFDTPSHIKDAAIKALQDGHVHYTSNYGLFDLREAVSIKTKTQNNVLYDPNDEIVITSGACEAIFSTMAAFLNPGDEVIVPTPIWGTYLAIPHILGAKVVEVPLKEENGFSLAPQEIEKYITSRTKMIIVVSPNNPTGCITKEEDLKGIAALAEKYNLLVLSDEIYEHLIYTGEKHISIASYSGMRHRTVVVNGFSKAYSMTGWRLGWLCAERNLVSSIVRTHQNIIACASSFVQYAGIAALKGPQDCVQMMREEFNKRRLFLLRSIANMPKISCISPSGAFYMFINIKQMNMTSMEAAKFFLEKAQIAIVPGSAFGAGGEGYLRLAYSTSMKQLTKAVERMNDALASL